MFFLLADPPYLPIVRFSGTARPPITPENSSIRPEGVGPWLVEDGGCGKYRRGRWRADVGTEGEINPLPCPIFFVALTRPGSSPFFPAVAHPRRWMSDALQGSQSG